MKKKKLLTTVSLVLAASLALVASGCTRTAEDLAPTGTASVVSAEDEPFQTGKIWGYLDDDTTDFTAFAESFDVNQMKCVRLDVYGEAESIYNTTDSDLIEEIFRAMDQITVTDKTDEIAADATQIFTFIDNDGNECSIEFNDNNLVGTDGIYLLSGDENLWDAAINLRENATESYTESGDDSDTDSTISGDPEDPMNGRAEDASKTVSHFSYQQESSGDGTEYIFGDALVVTIPPDWNGKYAMEQGNDYVTFYHTGSHEGWMQYDGSDGGILFGIYYSKDEESSENTVNAGLARDGGYYYFSFPSDMQAFMEDESIVEEYASLSEEVYSIAENAFSTVSD